MLNNKWLQKNLKFLGFYDGEIDEIIGTKTRAAILKFQTAYGLETDGIAGNITCNKIIEVVKNRQKACGAKVDGFAGDETISKYNEFEFITIKHFTKNEFTCKCGCGFNNIDINLVKVLEKIRSHFGDKPLYITSGCRCANHNIKVGGVQGSRHVLGKASDIYIKGVSSNELLNYTKTLVANGELRYTYTNNSNMSGVVHVDIL